MSPLTDMSTSSASVAFTATQALAASLVLRAGEQSVLDAQSPPVDAQNVVEAFAAPSLQQRINELWYRAPEPFRFGVSGALGTFVFYLLERFISNGLDQIESLAFVVANKDGISFFSSYMLQIVFQHLLHALLVYGLDTINTRQKYLTTLGGQYGAYFGAMIGSTVLNTWLRHHGGMSKDKAFVTTLILFSFVNYFVIGWIVRNSTTDDSGLEKKEDGREVTPDDNPATKTEGNGAQNESLQHTEPENIPRGGWIRREENFQMPTTCDSMKAFLLSSGERVANPAIHSQAASLHKRAP